MDNKKAKLKAILFKQFLESIIITELEHKFSDREKILIEMDILNDNDLETIDLNKNHKNIGIEELTNIINKLDIKKGFGEDKITNKFIQLTYNGPKVSSLNCLIVLCTMGTIQKCLKNHK